MLINLSGGRVRPGVRPLWEVGIMERERAFELLRGGVQSVRRWNRWRQRHTDLPNLSHADFSYADLSDADLTGVNLEGARFVRARLAGCRLHGANLKGANLRQADLNNAVLSRANLANASLKGASLYNADFRRAVIKHVSFEEADSDTGTKWPDDFDPQSVGLRAWPSE